MKVMRNILIAGAAMLPVGVANIPPAGNTKIDIKRFPGNDTMAPYVAFGVNRVKSDPQSAAANWMRSASTA